MIPCLRVLASVGMISHIDKVAAMHLLSPRNTGKYVPTDMSVSTNLSLGSSADERFKQQILFRMSDVYELHPSVSDAPPL